MIRKVIEWVGEWWVVDERPSGYTPAYKGESRADAECWLIENPLNAEANVNENAADFVMSADPLDNGLTPD